MKSLFVLLFAVISSSYAEPLGPIPGIGGLSSIIPGGITGGGKGPAEVLAAAKGISTITKDGKLLDVGGILGLNSKTDCIRLCPKPISDTSLKCVETSSFKGTPVCYQRNTLNKWVWPCVNNKKKPTKKPTKKPQKPTKTKAPKTTPKPTPTPQATPKPSPQTTPK